MVLTLMIKEIGVQWFEGVLFSNKSFLHKYQCKEIPKAIMIQNMVESEAVFVKFEEHWKLCILIQSKWKEPRVVYLRTKWVFYLWEEGYSASISKSYKLFISIPPEWKFIQKNKIFKDGRIKWISQLWESFFFICIWKLGPFFQKFQMFITFFVWHYWLEMEKPF